jgi:hypothetical protein
VQVDDDTTAAAAASCEAASHDLSVPCTLESVGSGVLLA